MTAGSIHGRFRGRALLGRLIPVLVLITGLAACRDGDPARLSKLQDIARWQDTRLAPGDSLHLMLQDRDAHVRLAAARAAGLIGRSDAVPYLLEVLDDPSLTVRAEACFSLGLTGGESAVRALEEQVADPHRAVRLAALAGLAQTAGGGPALLAATDSSDPREAAAAWDGLRRRIEDVDQAAVAAAMDSSLGRAVPEVSWRILRCAELTPDSTLVKTIAPLAASSLTQVRVHALRALACQENSDALDAVLVAARDRGRFRGRDRNRIDIALCRALGRLGHLALDSPGGADPLPRADTVTGILISAAGADDPHVAETALQAMAACVRDLPLPPAAAQRESLLPVWRIRLTRVAAAALESPHAGVRRAAVAAWALLRGSGCAPGLARLVTEEPEPVLQAAALRAVGAVHPDPLPLLLGKVGRQSLSPGPPGPGSSPDNPPLVRTAALEALDEVLMERPDALPVGFAPAAARKRVAQVLQQACRDSDFVVASTAAGLLAHYPDTLTVAALDGLWRRARGPGRFEIRRAVIKGLTGMTGGEPDSLPVSARDVCSRLLQEGFDSPDLRIRLEARAAARTTQLVPLALIPTEASLRETLPAVVRDPAQPPVAVPFKAPRVRCTTDRGEFVIALDGKLAPNTCAVFLDLIDKGFYDSLTFHRVVPDFVIQGGDPRGDGWGGPGYTIRSEWSPAPFIRGTVGIAHDGKDTGGSQFFVTLSPQPHLDGRYTVFGRVTDGMDVVDRMEMGDHFSLEVIP